MLNIPLIFTLQILWFCFLICRPRRQNFQAPCHSSN